MRHPEPDHYPVAQTIYVLVVLLAVPLAIGSLARLIWVLIR